MSSKRGIGYADDGISRNNIQNIEQIQISVLKALLRQMLTF